ncbi:acyl-CoA synthetase (AMP-forming)/AMP-acid ligase II [Mycolicibacterium rhodesiae NBB3]|uniref:Long-chain-fatty-acid--CoA ligase FadD13 n=1 Tax=Mycolicibacterium rhodesiae (strain NBB3) TaxID=710685 RepID=G8RKH1_MYCRN|nr:AMP-binding protein [Mycolicibacterium rhodesiae]AEV73573.1 acyl-CoA synthetase (AMP-forming)/AMP-acid ligase II [Mycolicibacterium rhodesiae NBB3]
MRIPLTTNTFLDRAERIYGDRTGAIDEPSAPDNLGQLTYRQLATRGRAVQAGLDRLDVPEGGRVAVVSHNSARLLELLLAVPSSGRILVPINFRLQPNEVSYIVDDCEADVLLVDPELDGPLAQVSAPHRLVLGGESDDVLLDFASEPQPWSHPDEDTIATLNYTSGTTGKPKGVCLTHRNIWINGLTFGLHMQVSDHDVLMHVLPMFHCNGWGMPYVATGLGVEQVVLRKVDGAEILRRVDAHGVTLMCGAPTVWNIVLDAARDWQGAIPGRDRLRIVCAGAPPPSLTIARIERELGWEFNQIYGLTETAPLVTVNRPRRDYDGLELGDRAKKLSRAGVPSLGTSVRIDEEGEVLVASNHVMAEYWNKKEETDAAIKSGWFHTGDGGVLGSDGYLTITDRKKDVIISGGENVSSIEVEDVLVGHPAIADAAVIATPDDKWGELVTAIVVPRDGQTLTEGEVIDFAKSKLAHYKAPKKVIFRSDIPYTATGKKQKFKLRAPYWTGERQVN